MSRPADAARTASAAREKWDVALIVFDCDGVLVDSEYLSAEVDRTILRRLGWDISIEEIARRYLGRTQAEYHVDVAARLGLAADWYVAYEHLYVQAFEARLRPVAGAKELLGGLSIPYCVASNSSRSDVAHRLALCGLSDLVGRRIFSGQDVARPKPAPDLHLSIMSLFNVAPDQVLVVEDSPSGLAAASSAGARSVALATNLVDRGLLAQADAVIDHLSEVGNLVRRAPSAGSSGIRWN